jgi:hypothetical protein
MPSKSNQPRRHSRPAMSSRRRRRRGHDVLIMLLLGVLAVVSALAWLAAHVLILVGVALIIGLASHGGKLHERSRARQGQVHVVAPLPRSRHRGAGSHAAAARR